MTPTMTCDRPVCFRGSIDISPIYPPKARTITLEPISRRSRPKHNAQKTADAPDRRSRKAASTGPDASGRLSRPSSTISGGALSAGDISPAPSEASVESTGSGRTRPYRPSLFWASNNRTESDISVSEKTITATVEPLVGGCLKGGTIGVRVNVHHTKPIRSLHGIIVTLYRQARVDMHPAIPLGPVEKGSEGKYEEYYPRSLTGLGGLSLSGAGSSHTFRKDLAQVMLPLYIDPRTMTSEVYTKLRVPDDAFPTISSVPGNMIDFKYIVEVVIDIQGKLGNQERNLGSLLAMTNARPPMDYAGAVDHPSAQVSFGPLIVDTAPIRRDKCVISSSFEVVIGTHESRNRLGKQRQVSDPVVELSSAQQPTAAPLAQHQAESMHPEADGDYWEQAQQDSYDPGWYPPYPADEHAYDPGAMQRQPAHTDTPPPLIPLPDLPDESQMSEKERIRQAESRLLPSQPPGLAAASTFAGGADGAVDGATAPYLPEEEEEHGLGGGGAQRGDVSGGTWVAETHYAGPRIGSTAVEDGEASQPRRAGTEASAVVGGRDGDMSTFIAATALSEGKESAARQAHTDLHDSHAEAAPSTGLPMYER